MSQETLLPQNPAPALTDRAATRSMALNLCDWMHSSIRWYGVESAYTETLWWRQPGGSGIYLGAVIVDGEKPDSEVLADLRRVQEAWGSQKISLWDCWGRRDLGEIGLVRHWKNPWYLRPAAPLAATAIPDGLSIEKVTTEEGLAGFERASWIGFEEPEEAPDIAFSGRDPFCWHPKETVGDPSMHYLVARYGGEVVAGIIAHVSAGMVGIYGLSTLPEFRRRGYARALVHAVVALRPDLPVCVQPDPPSVPLYTDIGFVQAGEIAGWG
jgi:GNAT superfamily N-acetyltransferase